MPVYEYECTKCGERTQRLQDIGEDASGTRCLSCGRGSIKKVFSVFGTPGTVQQSCSTKAPDRFT